MVFQSGCAWYRSDVWENRRFWAKSLVYLLVLVPVMYVNLHQLATSKIEVGCLLWTSSASSCGYREYNLVRINICATWSMVERASTILFNMFSRSLVTFWVAYSWRRASSPGYTCPWTDPFSWPMHHGVYNTTWLHPVTNTGNKQSKASNWEEG